MNQSAIAYSGARGDMPNQKPIGNRERGDSGPISERFRITAKEWVDADAAANLLEECKSATLSQMMQEQGDVPVNRAEMQVKASEAWREYLRQMVDHRKRANKLKVEMEWLRMRFMERNSQEASRRAEMKL